MNGFEVIRRLQTKGCVVVRAGKGSHVIVQCGTCRTVVPVHRNDLPAGTVRAIRRHLAPCIGGVW